MRLTGWAEYVPPAGSRYRVHYFADGHTNKPDLASMSRALDHRQGVRLLSMIAVGGGYNADAEVSILTSDMPLLSVLGTFLSDGGGYFWKIREVERIDDGVPSGAGLVVEKMRDIVDDPVQDVAVAATVAVRETATAVKKVGFPSLLLIGGAFAGFYFASKILPKL